jgi:hypothetical protein
MTLERGERLGCEGHLRVVTKCRPSKLRVQGSADANLRCRGVLGWMSATCGSNSELPLSNDYDDESFAQDAACAGAFV